jgi:hypothetical protein
VAKLVKYTLLVFNLFLSLPATTEFAPQSPQKVAHTATSNSTASASLTFHLTTTPTLEGKDSAHVSAH